MTGPEIERARYELKAIPMSEWDEAMVRQDLELSCREMIISCMLYYGPYYFWAGDEKSPSARFVEQLGERNVRKIFNEQRRDWALAIPGPIVDGYATLDWMERGEAVGHDVIHLMPTALEEEKLKAAIVEHEEQGFMQDSGRRLEIDGIETAVLKSMAEPAYATIVPMIVGPDDGKLLVRAPWNGAGEQEWWMRHAAAEAMRDDPTIERVEVHFYSAAMQDGVGGTTLRINGAEAFWRKDIEELTEGERALGYQEKLGREVEQVLDDNQSAPDKQREPVALTLGR